MACTRGRTDRFGQKPDNLLLIYSFKFRSAFLRYLLPDHRTVTLVIFELDLDRVEMNKRAKYLHPRSFSSKSVRTHRHTINGAIPLPGPQHPTPTHKLKKILLNSEVATADTVWGPRDMFPSSTPLNCGILLFMAQKLRVEYSICVRTCCCKLSRKIIDS